MSQIQNIGISLKSVVSAIDSGVYAIPKFQREFVWNISDIESLGDSIVRGYPISSILTMGVTGTLDIGYSPLNTEGAKVAEDNMSYLLDGQQRITSVAKIFLGLDDSREFYFDLLSILDEKYPEDNLWQHPWVKQKLDSNNNQFSPISDFFCRSFAISNKKEIKETRQFNRFISGKTIIENRFGSIINKFLRNLDGLSNEQLDKYVDYLNALMGSVGSYSISATTIDKNSDLDLVVRVFEKVNTTGIKLTLINLVNAKSFKTKYEKYNNGFADFLTESIRRYLSNNQLPRKFFDNILGYDKKTDSYGNLSRIIRTITIFESLGTGHQSKLTNKYMLSKESDFWFEMWNKIGYSLLDFYTTLEKEGISNIGNLTFYEYIGAIVSFYPKMSKNKIFIKEVKKYVLYMSLTKKGFNRSDLDIFDRFTEFAKHITDSHEFDKYKFRSLPKTLVEYTPSDVKDIKFGKNNAAQAVKHIIYFENQNSVGQIDLLNNKIDTRFDNDLEDHHLIANAYNKGNKKSIYSSIANLAVLDKDVNRYDIKDKKLSLYLEQIKDCVSTIDYENILKSNLLDHYNETLSELEIIEQRAEKMGQIINDYFER